MPERLFRQLSIHQKLVLLLMLTSTTVLGVTAASYITWDYYSFRESILEDLDVQAKLVLEHTAPAISFDVPDDARATMARLDMNPHVRMSCLYDTKGALVVVANIRADESDGVCPPTAPAPGAEYSRRLLKLSYRAPDGPAAGSTLYLTSDLTALSARLEAQVVTIGSVVLVGLILAYVISAYLQRIISRPIARLAETARAVSAQGDYSLRAAPAAADDLGVLVDAFNGMLDQIQIAQRERADLLQREQASNRLKDEFLATLSHELRTPLNAIVGWTHLIKTHGVPPEEMDRALERIERNALAQARLVDDLVDLSRITTGKLLLDVRPTDLVTVTSNALESCRPAADARQVRLETRFLAERLPALVDPERIQQVVWNLVSNAVRFTTSGGRVLVTLGRSDGYDVLTVSDTGAGIDPAFVPHVFEPFRQADAASTRAHGGLGLGLTIVRRLTEMHGGDVSVASAGLGQGAAFTVRLPTRQPDIPRPPATKRTATASLAGTSILVVDDDGDTLELLEALLTAAGASVACAASVEEAMRIAADRVPEVIVSDIAMPGQDGYDLMRQLKGQLGSALPRATIAVTAYATEADRDRVLAAGFRRHVTKPFDPAALIQTIRELLGNPAAAQ